MIEHAYFVYEKKDTDELRERSLCGAVDFAVFSPRLGPLPTRFTPEQVDDIPCTGCRARAQIERELFGAIEKTALSEHLKLGLRLAGYPDGTPFAVMDRAGTTLHVILADGKGAVSTGYTSPQSVYDPTRSSDP